MQIGSPPYTEKIEASSIVLSSGSPVFRNSELDWRTYKNIPTFHRSFWKQIVQLVVTLFFGRAMLQGPLARNIRIITVTDVDPRAFEILIRSILFMWKYFNVLIFQLLGGRHGPVQVSDDGSGCDIRGQEVLGQQDWHSRPQLHQQERDQWQRSDGAPAPLCPPSERQWGKRGSLHALSSSTGAPWRKWRGHWRTAPHPGPSLSQGMTPEIFIFQRNRLMLIMEILQKLKYFCLRYFCPVIWESDH